MGSVAYPRNVAPLELSKYMFNRVFFAALRAHAPHSPVFEGSLTGKQGGVRPPPTLQNKMLLPARIKPGLLTVEKRVPTKELAMCIFIWNVSMTKNPSLGENPPTNEVVFLKEWQRETQC
jgi:hypothetical protein